VVVSIKEKTMGVGEYINSKEAPLAQLHSTAGDRANQRLSRQALAEQARVGVPATRLSLPVSFGAAQELQQSVQDEDARHRSAFDTDVEGVDDSTIGGTSTNSQVNAPVYSNTHPYIPTWNETQVYDLNVPEGLGDQAMKAAGFESDESDVGAGVRSSVSVNDDDDDEADDEDTQTMNWAIPQDITRSLEMTMSGRLEGHLRATSKTPSRMSPNPTTGGAISSSTRFISNSNAANTGIASYSNGTKMNLLPQSLGNTPRNRFNFKTSRPYERLVQLSPTRRSSGPRTQPGRPESTAISLRNNEEKEKDPNMGLQEQPSSVRAYNVTDEAYNEVNHQYSKTKDTAATKNTPPLPKKRRFVSDYAQEILEKTPFHDLEKESFDYLPAASDTQAAVAAAPPAQLEAAETTAEKLSVLLNLRDEDRRAYLASLSLSDWETCGDQLTTEFGSLLVKIKDARQARRKTVAVFEAEIKRRHEQAQNRDAELGKKLAEMKEGGMGVLRGLGP
jgi:Extracellular mutant protein 11